MKPEYKIILCENIIDFAGRKIRCNKPRKTKKIWGGRAKYCRDCIAEKNRVKNNENYHRNKQLWKPQVIICRYEPCSKKIEIKDISQKCRKFCDDKCRGKHFKEQPSKYGVKNKNVNKSSKTETLCKCPKCGDEKTRKIFRSPSEVGKTLYKYCGPCRLLVKNVDCSVVSGYAVDITRRG